ncbi:peptidase domain-containing ABC transporter [Mucilaginibacter kameinonensis]|uniref:peptidase domain-containing ABC transporter n=1 Tax=Mucilaginibacter kameinonensis TaxID=452286 RepID=UPI000EF7EA43|nr:peptidase domain-containing ABC transporter [Mucilaginibacter kameinonensis]
MNIKVKQRDITDCGAACLASVSAHYKLNLPIAKIRQWAGTNKQGTSISGIIEAAKKLNFEAKGVRATFESLFKVPQPSIAHIIVDGRLHHFVVIHKITNKFIEIMDPADGLFHKKTHNEFKEVWSGALILLLPGDTFEIGDKTVSVNKRFFTLIYPHRSILIQVLTGAIIYTLLGLSSSIFVQKIIDYVLIDNNRNLLNIMSVTMVLLLVAQFFVGVIKSVFSVKVGLMIDAQLILGYYKHLLRLPQRFFDSMRVGEIISRVNDAVKIRTLLNDVSINLAVNVFIVIFSFAMMFTYYWKLALILLISVPVYLSMYIIANKVNKRIQRKLMENSAELEANLVESLNSIGTIKRFGLEDFSNEKMETNFVKLLDSVFNSNIASIYFSSSVETVSRLLSIILLWVGAYYVLDNLITPGELLSFYTLIGYFIGPVSSLIGMNKSIQDAVIAADRLFEIFDLEQEQHKDINLNAENLGDIIFTDVTFAYEDRTPVFNKLNLVIPNGKLTSIVGESGSGKSTIASLLQCLYKITDGNIYIGNNNIKYVSNSSLRKTISVVPQNIELFAGNLIDNIAVGDHDPDMFKVIKIADSLGILSFIESLPNGFQTYVGENGTALSGGQKQRIAIARALYRDPDILIFDEATSSLDSVSEKYIQDVIQSLINQHKTIIIIAHRLSTIYKSDKIVVLDKGSVVEEGTHQKLIEREDFYFRLWHQQFPALIFQ